MKHVIALAAAMLTACAGPAIEEMSDEAKAPLYCVGKEQCDLYWKRAQLWVAQNSRWKIQTATDVVITTFTPTGQSADYGYQVTREPLDGDGREQIKIQPMCANLFGCGPLNWPIVRFKRAVRNVYP